MEYLNWHDNPDTEYLSLNDVPEMEYLSLNDKSGSEESDGKIFTKLHLAAAKGNVEEITKLIDDGFDVDIAVHKGFKKGCTPLHLATEFKHINAMTALLSKGADFTLKNGDNETALMIAKNLNWREGARLIVKTFCTVCSKINRNTRSIFAQSNLLTDFDINISQKFRQNFEPITFAIQSELEEIVVILINHGFDVEAQDADGMTELHRVVKKLAEFKVPFSYETEVYANIESEFLDQTIVRLFTEKFSNVKNVRDNYGRTPVFYLYKGLPGRSTSHRFSSRAMVRVCWLRVYMLQQMLSTPALCANMHLPDYEGNTILHTVAKAPLSSYPYIEGTLETEFIVDRYLADGGDIDARNRVGYTALHCSSQHCNVKVALVYLKAGADINALTPQNETPYSILCKSEYAWSFERLMVFSYLKRMVVVDQPLCPLNQQLYERDNEIWMKAAEDVKRMILSDVACDIELEFMKSQQIDDFTTVYDMLHKSVHDLVSHTHNEELVDRDLRRDFPIFGYLVMSKIVKAKKRAKLLEPAKEALLNIVKFELPDACVNAILAHFENDDLMELIRLEID